LSLAQESFPGAEFKVSFEFLGLSSSANLSQPFGVSLSHLASLYFVFISVRQTISGSILERKSILATRQEGVWSKPPAQFVAVTPLGNYTSGTTTVANFANFSIADGATVRRLQMQLEKRDSYSVVDRSSFGDSRKGQRCP
jgi:hypothetical protein